jgi:uncharacterized membrane protein
MDMDLPADLLPTPWILAAHVLYIALINLALRHAPWTQLRRTDTLNVFVGACVGLGVLWSLKAGISPGLNFHLLGVTLLTLTFGWSLAVIGSSLVLLMTTLNGAGDWETFSVNALLMGALPATVTLSVLRLSERWLPPNFFVYVLVDAFLAAGLAMTATTLAASILFILSGIYILDQLSYEYLPYLPLVALPEALINGLLVTLLVGLRPEWVATFDDGRYLQGR